MKHFFKFFSFRNFFSRSRLNDRVTFSECIKLYTRIGNTDILKQFLEDYAIAATQKETIAHLTVADSKPPTFQTYREIKKLLDVIDQIEKNF